MRVRSTCGWCRQAARRAVIVRCKCSGGVEVTSKAAQRREHSHKKRRRCVTRPQLSRTRSFSAMDGGARQVKQPPGRAGEDKVHVKADAKSKVEPCKPAFLPFKKALLYARSLKCLITRVVPLVRHVVPVVRPPFKSN